MSTLISQFKAARRVSTPLIAIKTPDPGATIRSLTQAVSNGTVPPVIQYDVVRGMTPVNEPGQVVIDRLAGDDLPELLTLEVVLTKSEKLPATGIVFLHNAQRYLDNLSIIQALWNLRDEFKENFRTVVLLGPDFALPPELSNDMLLLDEPLPNAEELEGIVTGVFRDAEIEEPDSTTLETAVSAVSGLAAFPADQVVAMSLTREGLDIEGLWERKRQVIEQAPGLSVWRGGETFDDIGGLDNIKSFLAKVIAGTEPPRVVVFIDEIEKAIAGAGGDTSGVSQDQLGTLLSFMQDNRASGIICIGPPGTSKSMVAKATGNAAGVPTVSLDFGAMKGSHVGESEGALRNALKVIKSMAQDRALFIATCNSISALPPELRRRFTFGTFFFDLPTPQERNVIWSIYRQKYKLGDVPLGFDDDGWTGAEIRQCCDIAYRLRCTLQEASNFIIPVSRSAADQVEALRNGASGKYISATYAGPYKSERMTLAQSGSRSRAIQIQEA